MKQIDVVKSYAQKHCLIVDDMADIRTAVTRWCVDFGCQRVDTAGSGEEALDSAQGHAYDLFLIDYNLGSGKNGQQLIEEIRFHRHFKPGALFVLITGEASSQDIIHALEFQPDDYLHKPLNRNVLRQRLNNLILKSTAMAAIRQARDKGEFNAAIAAAKQAAALPENAKYQGDIVRCLGELFGESGQWDQALQTYNTYTTQGDPLWRRLGEARARLRLKQDDALENDLLAITSDAPLCVEARDLLAEYYSTQNQELQAQQALHEAIAISPRSVQRQRNLGQSAQKTKNNQLAVHAFRETLKHSKNTCNEQPEDFINLAQNLSNLSRESEAGSARELAKEALETLKQLDKKYYRHPVIQIRSKLVAADVHDAQGDDASAKRCTEQAIEIHDAMDYAALEHTSTQLCIDCAKAFMALGYFERGERLLEKTASISKDPGLITQIDKLRREPLTREGILHAAEMNKTGIQLYQNDKFEEAQNAFETVLDELPNHVGLNLNLIQTIISKTQAIPSDAPAFDARDSDIVRSSFARLGEFDPDSPHLPRYQYLYNKALDLGNPMNAK